MHFGGLVEGFFDHFEVMLRSKIVLEGPWGFGWSRKSIFRVRLRLFWRVLESFWRGFWRFFGIFFRYRFHYKFLYDFKMIFHGFWYPLDKQNQAKSKEGSAKINFSYCSLSNVFGNWLSTDFGFRLEAVLSPNRPSEATSKASVIKYANEEGYPKLNGHSKAGWVQVEVVRT